MNHNNKYHFAHISELTGNQKMFTVNSNKEGEHVQKMEHVFVKCDAFAVVQDNQKPVTTNVAGSVQATPLDNQVSYNPQGK